MVKYRSIKEIARLYGDGNTDGLHHFLKDSPVDPHTLQTINMIAIARRIKKPAILILDDTPSPRTGKHIEGIGTHHGADGFVKGQCAVTASVVSGAERYSWAIRGYRPKRSCTADQFKSKIELALDIIDESKEYLGKDVTVAFDAWYTCAPVLNRIQESGWRFVSAIKCNRVVYVGAHKTRVRHLAKGPRQYKTVRIVKREYRVAKKIVHLPNVGEVAMFISKCGTDRRYIVTNDLTMTARQAVKIYCQRTWIEQFHKEMKESLGFNEMFMRSWRGVQQHWTLVGIAYNTIALASRRQSRLKSFRKRISTFRETVFHDKIIHLYKKAG